ncbi:hypothetical protein, partial [Pseudomonas savastanoi]
KKTDTPVFNAAEKPSGFSATKLPPRAKDRTATPTHTRKCVTSKTSPFPPSGNSVFEAPVQPSLH